MASVFAHAFSAIALSAFFAPAKMPRRFWFLAILMAVAPDFDVVAFKFGIAYQSPFGHRGFTHSILFAIMMGLFIGYVQRYEKRPQVKLYVSHWFFWVTVSHGFLDALTTGGLGVAFFWPFDHQRYFLPWRVIKVSPLTISQFFGEWGLKVIKNELLWVFLPSTVLMLLGFRLRNIRSKYEKKY